VHYDHDSMQRHASSVSAERRYFSDRREPASANELYRRIEQKIAEVETERRRLLRRQEDRSRHSRENAEEGTGISLNHDSA
jgi:hypothetical protein